MTPEEIQALLNQYTNEVNGLLQESAGFERDKLAAQTKTSEKQIKSNEKISKADNASREKIAANQIKYNYAELAQNNEQFGQKLALDTKVADADIEQKKNELALQRDQLELDRGKAYADAWYNEQLVRLAEDEHSRLWAQLGLDYTKAAIDYASTPDKIFQLADFNAAMRGISSGQGTAAFGSGLAGAVPQKNSLANLYGSWGAVPGAMTDQAGAPGAASMLPTAMIQASAPPPGTGVPGDSWDGPDEARYLKGTDPAAWSGPPNARVYNGIAYDSTQPGVVQVPTPNYHTTQPATPAPSAHGPSPNWTDPRVAAAHAIIDANPPTPGVGWGPSELTALSGVANMLKQGASKWAPGSVEGLNTDQLGVLSGGLSYLGASPTGVLSSYYRSRPGQGNSTAA